MENLSPETPWQIIAGLITGFGTVISLLLGLVAFFGKRYVTQTDVRLKESEKDIGDLKVGFAKHSTEIKNIHHRIKQS